MFRDRGEEQIIYVRPDNESVEAKRERIEKYIPIDIGKVLGTGIDLFFVPEFCPLHNF